MTEIRCEDITALVARLCIQANTQLPDDLCSALRAAQAQEPSPVGKAILGDTVENFTFARERALPICQDTGMAVVYAELGQEVHITGGTLSAAVNAGVAKGYTEGHLRCSVVGDPLRRVNTADNTPAVLHLRLVEGDSLRITVAPKGFGSENMTRLNMFTPAATAQDITSFVVNAVSTAGSNPCPPVIVGVGLGGTSEVAAALAKEALLRPVGVRHADPLYAALEEDILAQVNALGIGPQGLGGQTTALDVHILTHPTHIAGLPCCVNLGCHVTRHASGVLGGRAQ